uniref:Uncharacterized protein n=1 Tax=viral metagenome TaxID=1070528 RepID=A0A6M3JB86_9ZZZZ
MTTEQKASTEQVSKETVSTTGDTKAVTTQPPTLTEERVQQLIAEATLKAVEQGKTLGKREMQAIKDREVGEIKRKADLAERRAKSYETGFTDLDEDTRSRIETQKAKSELDFYKSREQEEETKKQQEAYFERLNQSLKDEVTALGVDPSDKRIDYAEDAKDYFDGRKRFSESLSKIIKSEKENLEKSLLSKADERFKALETDFRKQHGLDSQDTTTPTGVVNESEADFMAKFGSGELPTNKVNVKRYEEIQKKHYK